MTFTDSETGVPNKIQAAVLLIDKGNEMKKSQIGKGRFYSDGKEGVREVLDEGPEYKLYNGVEDDDCLIYRCLSARNASDIGKERNSTRTAFATWAKLEIPAAEVQEFLLNLQAGKVAAKLTAPQRAFLLTFPDDISERDLIECPREEFRVAASCRVKGIITNMPERLGSKELFFEVEPSPLGLAVLSRVRADGENLVTRQG